MGVVEQENEYRLTISAQRKSSAESPSLRIEPGTIAGKGRNGNAMSVVENQQNVLYASYWSGSRDSIVALQLAYRRSVVYKHKRVCSRY